MSAMLDMLREILSGKQNKQAYFPERQPTVAPDTRSLLDMFSGWSTNKNTVPNIYKDVGFSNPFSDWSTNKNTVPNIYNMPPAQEPVQPDSPQRAALLQALDNINRAPVQEPMQASYSNEGRARPPVVMPQQRQVRQQQPMQEPVSSLREGPHQNIDDEMRAKAIAWALAQQQQ